MYFNIEMYLRRWDTCHVGTLTVVSPHHRFYCSTRLAKSGMVPGPPTSRDRLSINSPTSAEAAQADLLTPHPSIFVEIQFIRLGV